MTQVLTRRSMLGHGAVALAGGAAIAFAVPDIAARAAVPHDPMLQLLTDYETAHQALDDSDIEADEDVETYCRKHLDPLWQLLGDDTPETTTIAGAIAALAAIADNGWIGPHQDKMAASVLAFLQARA